MFEPRSLCDSPVASLSQRRPSSLANTRLAQPSFLSGDEVLALSVASASRFIVQSGAELVNENEPSSAVYFLETGWACQYMATGDGRRQISSLLLPGDICNLDVLLFGQLNCSVRMLTSGSVLTVSRERIADLAAAHHGIARAVTWLGALENAILTRRTFCLGRLSALERMAHFLCELSVRLGFSDEEGETSFTMPLTQEQIADVLGLTPVHVNRMLLQLRTAGLLASTKRTVVISDVAALRRAGEFQPYYLHASAPLETSSAKRQLMACDLR